MTDGFPGNGYFVPVTEVDVKALRYEAYDRGYRAGLQEGRSIGHAEGYIERGHDILERLRTLDSIGDKELSLCISEIEKMVETSRA